MTHAIKKVVLPLYFNLLKALRKLKLIKTPAIKVCISTIEKYAHKTIPDLLASLFEAGFSKEDIYVIEGGHQKSQKVEHEVNYYQVDHNSFDLTALISVIDLDVQTNYWFLLHDTCSVGPMFKDLVSNVPHTNPDVIVLRNFPSMNIGLYKKEYLEKKRSVLMTMRNDDYTAEGIQSAKKKAIEQEDILFKQPDIRDRVRVYNPWLMKLDGNYKISATDNHQYYSDRIVEYFPQADLYKFKANFNLSRTNIVDL